jgi:hypothetical protein
VEPRSSLESPSPWLPHNGPAANNGPFAHKRSIDNDGPFANNGPAPRANQTRGATKTESIVLLKLPSPPEKLGGKSQDQRAPGCSFRHLKHGKLEMRCRIPIVQSVLLAPKASPVAYNVSWILPLATSFHFAKRRIASHAGHNCIPWTQNRIALQ